jgi:hypothetical protein
MLRGYFTKGAFWRRGRCLPIVYGPKLTTRQLWFQLCRRPGFPGWPKHLYPRTREPPLFIFGQTGTAAPTPRPPSHPTTQSPGFLGPGFDGQEKRGTASNGAATLSLVNVRGAVVGSACSICYMRMESRHRGIDLDSP